MPKWMFCGLKIFLERVKYYSHVSLPLNLILFSPLFTSIKSNLDLSDLSLSLCHIHQLLPVIFSDSLIESMLCFSLLCYCSFFNYLYQSGFFWSVRKSVFAKVIFDFPVIKYSKQSSALSYLISH